MRLAATLTTISTESAATGRGASRQPVALKGTLRGADDAPCEIAILDVSESGFLAELPHKTALPIEARVRIAATMLGVHEAVVVRRDGLLHGFAFVRPIGGDLVDGLDGEQLSTVTPFPGVALPAPAGAAAPAPVGRLSPRASLGIMLGVSAGIWLTLAGVVAGIALLS